MTEIGIGTVLYVYDGYMRSAGTFIEQERARFLPITITGETRGKWLSGKHEINKKTLKVCGVRGVMQAYTAQQVEDHLWLYEHHRKLVIAVECCRNAATLRKVAEAVGYEPGKPADRL